MKVTIESDEVYPVYWVNKEPPDYETMFFEIDRETQLLAISLFRNVRSVGRIAEQRVTQPEG